MGKKKRVNKCEKTRLSELYHALHHRLSVQDLYGSSNTPIPVNHQFPDGSFPLHIAVDNLHFGNVKHLLTLSASPDFTDRHGLTPLMIAVTHLAEGVASGPAVHIVKALLAHRCRVNLIDAQGRTALHRACSKGVPIVVKMLLSAGARVDGQDRWLRQPLHMALLSVPHTLTRPPPPYTQSLITHPTAPYTNTVRLLLSHGCELNHSDSNQATPLYLAVSAGDHCVKIARLLIEAGADIGMLSRHNMTPLMRAVRKGHYGMARLLVWYNCCVDQVYSDTGKSCLYTACQRGSLDLVRLLLVTGCDINPELWIQGGMKNPLIYTARHRACHFSPALMGLLEAMAATPQSLCQLCRVAVRGAVGRGIHQTVRGCPPGIRDYVLLQDVCGVRGDG